MLPEAGIVQKIDKFTFFWADPATIEGTLFHHRTWDHLLHVWCHCPPLHVNLQCSRNICEIEKSNFVLGDYSPSQGLSRRVVLHELTLRTRNDLMLRLWFVNFLVTMANSDPNSTLTFYGCLLGAKMGLMTLLTARQRMVKKVNGHK